MNQLITVSHSGLLFVLLCDEEASDDVNFCASTLATQTQCTPITRSCGLAFHNDSISIQDIPQFPQFNCSSGFTGDLGFDDSGPELGGQNLVIRQLTYLQMPFFNDSAMTLSADAGNSPVNPFYFGVAATIGANLNGSSFPLFNDSEIIAAEGYGFAYILSCNVTVYDVNYTWVNGSFDRFTSISSSNATTAGIINYIQTAVVSYQVQNAVYLSAYSSETSQDLADKVALAYSQSALGYSAAAFSQRLNQEEQLREVVLVTRLPFAPFYALISANCLYAICSIVLAGIAMCIIGSSKRIGNVQEQLNVQALVARAFQIPEKLIRDGESFELEGEVVGEVVVGVKKGPEPGNGCILISWKRQ